MSIEDEVFDRKKLNIDKLLKFGFKRDGENYKYSQENFEKLYKQRFEKDNAYMRSIQYNKKHSIK